MALPVRKNRASVPPQCPLSECMSLLRGAWAPNVIWYLSEQPRRFGELRVDIPRVSARVLSARLRELQSRGVVNRRVVPSSPPSVEYELTDLGRELVPAIRAIVAVGHKLKQRPHAAAASPKPPREQVAAASPKPRGRPAAAPPRPPRRAEAAPREGRRPPQGKAVATPREGRRPAPSKAAKAVVHVA
jgi:DNA-binding HxlR family transcriptional regulator